MAFKLKNPRKGTETDYLDPEIAYLGFNFQIKESPEGDWNIVEKIRKLLALSDFQIKESPEGDWNHFGKRAYQPLCCFQIKESPEGDWNLTEAWNACSLTLSN